MDAARIPTVLLFPSRTHARSLYAQRFVRMFFLLSDSEGCYSSTVEVLHWWLDWHASGIRAALLLAHVPIKRSRLLDRGRGSAAGHRIARRKPMSELGVAQVALPLLCGV